MLQFDNLLFMVLLYSRNTLGKLVAITTFSFTAVNQTVSVAVYNEQYYHTKKVILLGVKYGLQFEYHK